MQGQEGSAEENRREPRQGHRPAAGHVLHSKFIAIQEDMSFNFGLDSLQPAFFPLQFEENKDGQNGLTFKPEGRANFDDLAEIKELKPHRVDQFKLSEAVFPPDFFNHSRVIPKPRSSGED
jgi:hypothetical protein